MPSADFDRHLDVLSREDTHYLQKNWEESARWIFEYGAKGEDIAPALSALVTVYLEATQIGVLRAAAAAVAVHDLRARDVVRLRQLLTKSKYRDWIFEGMGDAVGKGLDLEPAVPLLLEFCGAREWKVIDLLLRFAGKRRFAEMARKIAHLAPAVLPEFVKEGQSRKRPVESALPDLVAQLADAKLAKNAATTLRWIVELGADLSGVVEALRPHVDSPNEELATEAAYCLAYHHAAKRDWPEVDALLGNPRAAWGAGRALRVRLAGSDGDDVPEVVDRVAAGLLSPDQDTARRALTTLRDAKEKDRRCAPSPGLARTLAASLDDRVAEYLHLALAPHELRALQPAAARLAAAPVACAICARLPRTGSWSHSNEVPPDYSKLTAKDGLSRCPECGRYYERSYEDEWDDMSHFECWSLVRWTPPEVLAEAKGAALEQYRDSLPAWIERLRSELRHPALVVRVEAAFDLAAYFCANALWSDLAELIASSETAVLIRVLESVRKRNEDPAPAMAALNALLASPDFTVRSRAASLVAGRAVAHGDPAELHRLLASTDRYIVAATAEAMFQGMHKGFDAAPYLGRLLELRVYDGSAVSPPVRRILAAMATKGGLPDPLPVLIQDLASPNLEDRKSAAFEIGQLAPVRPDAAKAVPLLVRLLPDRETVFGAMGALQSLGSAGADIAEAMPTIVACALDPNCYRREDMVYWLQRLVEGGLDLRSHVAAIATLLGGSESMQSAAHQLLLGIFRKGGDLSSAVSSLRGMLDEAPPYLRESAARLLTEWHVKTMDLTALGLLLRHQRPEPPGMCATTLRELRFDLRPLLPDLVALLASPRSWVRDQAKSALVAFAKSDPEAKAAVLAALAVAGESADPVRDLLRR